MTERLTDEWGFFIRSARQFERFRSPYQAVEVHDSVPFGKLFRLDGHFMTSEKDEFFYHENLVHLAALTHPRPERALIVGGGDGGSAEELLKHPSIAAVTLAEIDVAVVDIARKYLPAVHRGALDDPRLTLKIGDGFEYVRSDRGALRPDRARSHRSGRAVRGAVHARVLPCLRGPAESGRRDDAAHRKSRRASGAHPRTLANLREAFALVTPYLTSIPLYGGMWMMACASATLDPKSLSALRDRPPHRAARAWRGCSTTTATCTAPRCALPNFVRELVA